MRYKNMNNSRGTKCFFVSCHDPNCEHSVNFYLMMRYKDWALSKGKTMTLHVHCVSAAHSSHISKVTHTNKHPNARMHTLKHKYIELPKPMNYIDFISFVLVISSSLVRSFGSFESFSTERFAFVKFSFPFFILYLLRLSNSCSIVKFVCAFLTRIGLKM